MSAARFVVKLEEVRGTGSQQTRRDACGGPRQRKPDVVPDAAIQRSYEPGEDASKRLLRAQHDNRIQRSKHGVDDYRREDQSQGIDSSTHRTGEEDQGSPRQGAQEHDERKQLAGWRQPPRAREEEDRSENSPGGDARESGLGEAISHDDLQQSPGEAQHAAHQETESRARQPQLPDDCQVCGVRRSIQQSEDDAIW